ncbi:class I SAM-dependent DNA methyltransferase [Calditrichota bacterium]
MNHVDYSQWVQFILEIFSQYGLHPPQIEESPLVLECGCGTGTVAIHLTLRGYQVEGFDSSLAMIGRARNKVRTLNKPPKFLVMDFLDLDVNNHFDVVLSLYDSVNYLMDEKVLAEFFLKVKGALKPDGLFIFDVCTRYNSLANFNGKVESESGSGFKYIRRMNFDKVNNIQENRFEIQLKSDRDKVYVETHAQKIYEVNNIVAALKNAGLTIENSYEGFDFSPPKDDALRVHFVCRNLTS